MLRTLFRFAWRRWHAVLALLFVLAMGLELSTLRLLGTTEHRLADLYMVRHAPEYKPDPDIIVIDVDDSSLDQMKEAAGLWPWPREVHADLLDALSEFGPRAVVFDIAFSEPDLKRPKSDERLSQVVGSLPAIYLPAAWLDHMPGPGTVPLRDVSTAFGIRQAGPPQALASLQLPNVIARDFWRLGLVNRADDDDGVLRRYRLFTDIAGWQLPSIPARVAGDFGARLPDGKDFLMRWPQRIHVHMPYAGLYLTLTEKRPELTDAQVRDLDGAFRNKIVVIGVSATSAFDVHRTPLHSSAPGADVLATAIDNLKNGHAVLPASPLIPFMFGAVSIVLLAYAFYGRINPLYIGAGLAAVSLAAVAAADAAVTRDSLVPLATPLIFAWIFFLFAAVAGYLREMYRRRQTVALFGRFLNPNVVRQLDELGQTIEGLSGHARNVTVLFADIRGFTTMSETKPAQEVVNLLNRHFNRQVEVVFRHGGTLDKFIGDCIMAFWGAPLDDPEHAKHAIAAAIEMQEALLAFKQELADEGSDVADFDIGIGVHSGPAVIGFIGAQRKLDYTAIGDTVNLASRVEGLTKGVARVLVTKETMLACGATDEFEFDHKGSFAVKGRAAAVELYEPRRKN